jgi:Ca2+/Na+ antiporter
MCLPGAIEFFQQNPRYFHFPLFPSVPKQQNSLCLGSNVANLIIILGLAILISRKSLILKEQSNKELVQFLFLSSIIPLFIFQRGSLGPVLGIVLLILFTYFDVTVSRKTEYAPTNKKPQPQEKNLALVSIKFLVGIALIIILSKFAVDCSVDIADFVRLPT